MIDINNVFVCIAAPLLAASFCLGKKYFHPVFFMLTGMGVCLLSAYINTFIAALYQTTAFHAATEISPVIEEVMKLLPLLFYLLIFEPEPEHIKPSILSIAAGFATFENICYLVQNGTTNFGFLLIRGFGTGAMHILCGAVIGYGLIYVWRRTWLKLAGTFGLLGVCIVFHGIYNLLIAYGGRIQYIAYLLPMVIIILSVSTGKMLLPHLHSDKY